MAEPKQTGRAVITFYGAESLRASWGSTYKHVWAFINYQKFSFHKKILSGVTIKTKPEHTHKVQIEVLSNGWKNWVKQVFKRKMTEKDGGAVTGKPNRLFVDKNWEVMEGITQLVRGVSV